MIKVKDIVCRLFPHGTNLADPTPPAGASGQAPEPDRRIVPGWPPDAFAFGATLLDLSGCYSHPRYVGWLENFFDRKEYRDEVRRVAEVWSEGEEPSEIQQRWDRILAAWDEDIHLAPEIPLWWDDVVMLTMIADEACQGIGFAIEADSAAAGPEGAAARTDGCPPPPKGSIPYYFLTQHEAFIKGEQPRLKHIPASLCLMAPRRRSAYNRRPRRQSPAARSDRSRTTWPCSRRSAPSRRGGSSVSARKPRTIGR